MNKLSERQRTEIDKLGSMAETDIDTSDIPEKTHWEEAVMAKFYRPIKRQVSIRLDADMLEWFKVQGGKYQTHINQVLRNYMEANQVRNKHVES